MLITELNAGARSALRRRAETVCVTYPDHDMPQGCTPTSARVGVEIVGAQVRLLVEHGVAYAGPDQEASEWLHEGQRYFADFDALISWLESRDWNTRGEAEQHHHTLTDLSQVRVAAPGMAIDSATVFERLRQDVVGQDAALRTVAELATRHVGKRRPRRPASGMLIGPTGTGKTETATALARVLSEATHEDWKMTRLDMSEFSEAHSVARLHGAPPGYVGYSDGTDLATELRSNPCQVLVLDEFEKAAPQVQKALMNLLDAGRLATRGSGAVDGTAAIILMTSNLAADRVVEIVTDDPVAADRAARQLLIAHNMPPELVGRVTDVCVFRPLSPTALAEVAARSVLRVGQDFGIEVTWIDPNYLTGLLRRLRDNRAGVRGLEYLVESEIGPQCARLKSSSTASVVGDPPALVVTPDHAEDADS